MAPHSEQRTRVPGCEKCQTKTKMTLARRVPAPSFGDGYELRTFLCPQCGHTQTVSVAPDAQVLPDAAS